MLDHDLHLDLQPWAHLPGEKHRGGLEDLVGLAQLLDLATQRRQLLALGRGQAVLAGAGTIVRDDGGPEVPELVRRIQLSSCHVDPPAALVPALERMTNDGIQLGDVLADSGYAYRKPDTWALPLRRLGARLVVDPHPNDRGPHGTHHGAIRWNGNLYCPATPQPLLQLGPLARNATPEQTAAHDQNSRSALLGGDISPQPAYGVPAGQGSFGALR